MQAMRKKAFYFVNAITVYRIVAAPVLLYTILIDEYFLFVYLLGISFFTDLIDGMLARMLNVTSEIGTRLDSIGDDLTVLMAFLALIIFKEEFFHANMYYFLTVFLLFVLQNIVALLKFRKTTSYHTYLAKAAAIFQGLFFLQIFFMPEPMLPLFFLAVICTGLELIEEILLVILMPSWQANVKGLYWVLGKKTVKT